MNKTEFKDLLKETISELFETGEIDISLDRSFDSDWNQRESIKIFIDSTLIKEIPII